MPKTEEFSKFEIPRLPNESTKAYAAKMDYVLMSERSLDKLVALYQERYREKPGVAIPSRNRTTICLWSGKFNWAKTAQDFDNYEADRLFEKQLEKRRAAYEQQLQEFQRHHLAAGKRAFQTAAISTQQILEFVEENPHIDSWEDCVRATNVVKALFPIADLWAKSLCVERLLQQNFDPADLG